MARAAAGTQVLAIRLDLSIDAAWAASITGASWLTTDGAQEGAIYDSANQIRLTPEDPAGVHGLALAIQDAGTDELWLEAGLIAGTDPGYGFGRIVDFDWFFGDSSTVALDGLAGGATEPANLRLMQEAQARVTAVSPAIPFQKS